MCWNIRLGNLCNVAGWTQAVVLLVDIGRAFIDFRREDAVRAYSFQRQMKCADARKKIDKFPALE